MTDTISTNDINNEDWCGDMSEGREVYEVLCDGVAEARVFRFWSLAAAMEEAERVCRTVKMDVRVVRVCGTFVSEPRWIEQ